MTEELKIRTLRQERAIAALLNKESLEVKELGQLIGALNPSQIISELRIQGFEKIIKTIFFNRLDRDGKVCRQGKYSIPAEYHPSVIEFLRKNSLITALSKTRLFDLKQVHKCNYNRKV